MTADRRLLRYVHPLRQVLPLRRQGGLRHTGYEPQQCSRHVSDSYWKRYKCDLVFLSRGVKETELDAVACGPLIRQLTNVGRGAYHSMASSVTISVGQVMYAKLQAMHQKKYIYIKNHRSRTPPVIDAVSFKFQSTNTHGFFFRYGFIYISFVNFSPHPPYLWLWSSNQSIQYKLRTMEDPYILNPIPNISYHNNDSPTTKY